MLGHHLKNNTIRKKTLLVEELNKRIRNQPLRPRKELSDFLQRRRVAKPLDQSTRSSLRLTATSYSVFTVCNNTFDGR
jgi:hypothetical protein